MTTETVEVTHEVIDEEDVNICDDCGKEVTQGVTFTPDKGDRDDLHVHSDCSLDRAMSDDAEYFDNGHTVAGTKSDIFVFTVTTIWLSILATYSVIASGLTFTERVALMAFSGIVCLVWISMLQAMHNNARFAGA